MKEASTLRSPLSVRQRGTNRVAEVALTESAVDEEEDDEENASDENDGKNCADNSLQILRVDS